MKRKKHYQFYLQCMETGYLLNKQEYESTGLCGAAAFTQIDSDILNLFEPDYFEKVNLAKNGQSTGWWGYEGHWLDENGMEREYGFTTLRQTIVLFMACIAGEKF